MSGIDVLGSNPSIQYKASYAHPYASSISSSASSSSSSIFSLDGLSTQSSVSSTSTNSVDVIWEHDGEYPAGGRGLAAPGGVRSCSRGTAPKAAEVAVPREMRKHPRRTSNVVQSNGVSCTRPPPCLLRQSERKVNFVDNLVDTASQIVEIIWPLSAVSLRSDSSTGCKGVLPLRTFIQETLRRSRTSYSTLQVALYYLIKIKSHVPSHDLTHDQSRAKPVCRAMQCGRRMFLAALILASKYLQDRNYSARAWSKISGLNTTEINQNELMFLEAVGWRLHISEATFQRWTDIVLKYTPSAGGMIALEGQSWRTLIPKLTPELEEIDVEPMKPSSMGEFNPHLVTDSPSPRSTGPRGADCPAPVSVESTAVPAPELNSQAESCVPVLPALPAMPRLPMLPTPHDDPPVKQRRHSCCECRRPGCSPAPYRPSLPLCPKTSTLDGYPTLLRRSSLACSTSSASSPESMVSDVSTLSSQSSQSFQSSQSSRSSLSSSFSGTNGAALPRLAVQATMRSTGNSLKETRKHLGVASPIDETSFSDAYSSPETYFGRGGRVPDLSSFSLRTPVDISSTHEAAQSLCELSGAICRPQKTVAPGSHRRQCRKRGRTGSEDLQLQNHVRRLMRTDSVSEGPVLADGTMANVFRKSESANQTPSSVSQLSALGFGASLSGPAGMKRACCGSEARKIALHPSLRADYMS
ncbi:hypothetical protein AOCH_006312 [Aspergillus ochraceoroseus]|uniref:G1/S-specific cyclin Pcl5 n=1 Tax=Aspergillus ochraceoroseus TaxID=138278 RepID=A0A0F8V2S8_9EURO|nr:hypothetical protein AOCH_006312 [Aspergillus ochraceoroseus]